MENAFREKSGNIEQARHIAIEDTRTRIKGMIAYLNLKVGECDWHGVVDAAMDLRDLDNYLQGLLF